MRGNITIQEDAMKSIKKYLFIMAALAAVFGFVACSDDDEPSTVATYKNTYSPYYTYLVTFLDDNTWSQAVEYDGKKETMAAGTYKGNPSADGKIYITPTKYLNSDDKLAEIPKEYQEEETITNKKFTYNYMSYTRQ